MRIGIEAQRIFRKKKHGMDNAALQIIKQIQKIALLFLLKFIIGDFSNETKCFTQGFGSSTFGDYAF